MTADRWSQIENIFSRAIELGPKEREAFLAEACLGDAELRGELNSLLACDVPDQRLVEMPAEIGSEPDQAGRRIGPYRLIRVIGHGGMGAVYLGVRDDDQYQKQVAIKLLKRGMDTEHMLSRFRQERQILANLEHPFIARLIDGGATEDGLPYFVMEYVDGVPITKYCADGNLSVPERLRLFRLVCEAVQHAHQNLVVHRDLKPSNILTTKEGVPKLLDFGIAKVLAPGMTAGATLTQGEFRMLTPDYASPEQVKGLPVSTASDTYSLGAVLYELLTGQRPHRFQSGSITDMERTICETEPEKPSTAAARDAASPAGVRNQLRRQLSGDLDNIIPTAMRKDPQRRYASAAEFSEDLRRHMEGLTVRAQEDRWSYRASKFIRRNRLSVAATCLVALTLVGGIVSTTIQARRAERRFDLVRGLARTTLFELYDEMERLPGSTTLRAATVRTVVKYLDTLAGDGSRDPELDLEMAVAYERAGNLEGHPYTANLGSGRAAIENYRKALTIYERIHEEKATRAKAMRGLIDTNLKVAQLESLMGNPAVAAAHSHRASAIANEAASSGGLELPPTTQSSLYFRLADAEYSHGSTDGEINFYRKAVDVAQNWIAKNRIPAAISARTEAYRNLGSALGRSGDLRGALENHRRALKSAEEMRELNDVPPDLQYGAIGVLMAMGDVLAAPDDPNLGDPAGAVKCYQQALRLSEQMAASDKRNVYGRKVMATSFQRLGMVSLAINPADALSYYQKSMQISDELNAGDPQNAEYRYHSSRAHIGMGEALHRLGRNEEAVTNLKRAIALQKALFAVSPERIWNLRVLSRSHVVLGNVLIELGETEQALRVLTDALQIADQMLQRAPTSLPHQLDRADALEALGGYYLKLARRPGVKGERKAELKREAQAQYQRSLEIWRSWTRRKVAAPYAGTRENQVVQAIAAIGPL